MKNKLLNMIYLILLVILSILAIVFTNIYIFIIGIFSLTLFFILYYLIKCEIVSKKAKPLFDEKKYDDLEVYYNHALQNSLCLQEYYFNIQRLILIYMISSQEEKAIVLMNENKGLKKVKTLYYYRFLFAIANHDLQQAIFFLHKLQNLKLSIYKKQQYMANKIFNMIQNQTFDEEVYEKTSIPLVKKICESIKNNTALEGFNFLMETTNYSSQKGRWTVLLNVLSILSICLSIIIIGTIVNVRYQYNLEISYYMTKNLWILYLFIPIPLAAIIYGIKNIEKYKVKSNIIVGSIFTIALLIYGSFSFFLADEYNTNATYIDFIEQKIQIDIPSEATIIQKEYEQETTVLYHNALKSESIIYFNNDRLIDVSNFKPTLSNQEKDFIPITFSNESKKFDYYTIYNLDTNHFFDLKYTSKTNYLCLAYKIKENILLVSEFYRV